MTRLPIVLLHGYSDRAGSLEAWRTRLVALGYDARMVHPGEYVSLSNEITIKDIAEGFDRALRIRAGLDDDEPFDAIVHSTGMLVIRAWLTACGERKARLKHLIGLAPATFGSPLAHKGRSWLGAVFKGSKTPGPDFLNAGDRILAALELGSRETWDLAHADLVAGEPWYGPTARTPYPFIFIGLKSYGGFRKLVNEPGTDGTVRWAGAGFSTRKLTVDLSTDGPKGSRLDVSDWRNALVPLVFLKDHDHTSILQAPDEALVTMVREALEVRTGPAYEAWRIRWTRASERHRAAAKARRWQQFVIHARDERGDPIPDYFVELSRRDARGRLRANAKFDMKVHAWQDDPSYRCFHVDLDALRPEDLDRLVLRIIASSGSELVGYHGVAAHTVVAEERLREHGKWDAAIDLTPVLKDVKFRLFYPYTTTLVEIVLDREPMPLEGRNRVMYFV